MSGTSSIAAHCALQYSLSEETGHVQGGCAHLFFSSVAIESSPTLQMSGSKFGARTLAVSSQLPLVWMARLVPNEQFC
jgi:hypothetical protein